MRITGFPDWQIIFLETGALPPDGAEDINEYVLLDWRCPIEGEKHCPVQAVWTACRDQIMADWKDKHTRPYGWWLFDSNIERKKHPRGWHLSRGDSIPEDQRAWLDEHELGVDNINRQFDGEHYEQASD